MQELGGIVSTSQLTVHSVMQASVGKQVSVPQLCEESRRGPSGVSAPSALHAARSRMIAMRTQGSRSMR